MSIISMSQYHMPAEWEKHKGTIMVWPQRPGSWPHEAREARKAFRMIITELVKHEEVYVAVSEELYDDARAYLGKKPGLHLVSIETDDAWARDIGPTFIKNNMGNLLGINWGFNAWGGHVDGLYPSWDKDNRFAKRFLETYHYPVIDLSWFILEGGSIHTDGEGTLLVTETCLLSEGRNPSMNRKDIEGVLKKHLGVEKILWLPRGIYNDETNEHVDNICAFVAPGEVVLAWTDKEEDPQYELSRACYEYLSEEWDAKGRKLKIHKLPIPDYPILVEPEDLEGYVFEEGEDVREVGERLAASYVNFYFANDILLLPIFGGKNTLSDFRAKEILQRICPDREILMIPARDILAGGGNIHCITQQIPK